MDNFILKKGNPLPLDFQSGVAFCFISWDRVGKYANNNLKLLASRDGGNIKRFEAQLRHLEISPNMHIEVSPEERELAWSQINQEYYSDSCGGVKTFENLWK